MSRTSALLLISLLTFAAPSQAAPKRAKNVILFLADAGGVATVNAASILGYNEPQKLFIQSWPNVGLMDTSTASQWVTDSAAGMTAIVTGRKTNNGVVSQGPDAVRGKRPGTPLKTILEYAEERGLSTGVVTDMSIADATPAACYAHMDDRGRAGDIFLQVFSPRAGDGVDAVMGAGRSRIYGDVKASGQDLDSVAAARQRKIYPALGDVPPAETRPIVLLDKDMDVPAASRLALKVLSRNRKGYFLMIEWDAHTDDPARGLAALVGLDKLIREIAGLVNPKDTLLVFAADHSFDLRVAGGLRSEPLLKGLEEWKAAHSLKEPIRLPAVRVDHTHTGEEVVVAALGPGAERVGGFFPNTRLFHIMMEAYGWKE